MQIDERKSSNSIKNKMEPQKSTDSFSKLDYREKVSEGRIKRSSSIKESHIGIQNKFPDVATEDVKKILIKSLTENEKKPEHNSKFKKSKFKKSKDNNLSLETKPKVSKNLYQTMTMRQIEVEHANLTYANGTFMKKNTMKDFLNSSDKENGQSYVDLMRMSKVDPEKTSNPLERVDRQFLEKSILGDKVFMGSLIDLSDKLRLTHYYDGASHEKILECGGLQSKERRKLLSQEQEVPSKSSATDDALGNTDHVFFFVEYCENKDTTPNFRSTRFGDEVKLGEVLTAKQDLDGTERRVSFPLNSVPMDGVHGYLVDINSKYGGVNPPEDIFSAQPMYTRQKETVEQLFLNEQKNLPTQGVHLLVDLVRQRLRSKNFPGNKKTPEKMLSDLKKLNPQELYTFLFRKHPNKEDAVDINPQILVPGSVSFNTPGVQFETPQSVIKKQREQVKK